nr:MAG TPA: hypothetical protein [Caudoviricetes sp.]DAM88104.1 MAG TPA: hypothetical protein [Caudoviricetes sp.]DAM88136.1 MAG TPA: hypothetical protein [Caudoviricetes sp.]DAS67608.1 MAG TPA: hypothetical protein [Caudoviricetes sp.]
MRETNPTPSIVKYLSSFLLCCGRARRGAWIEYLCQSLICEAPVQLSGSGALLCNIVVAYSRTRM